MWRTLKAYLYYTWGGLHRYFGNQNNLSSEHRRAVHYFGRALQARPSLRRARLARAVILWRELEASDAALEDLNLLIEQDPGDGAALFNRALTHQQAGRYEAALSDVERYLALPETNDSYYETAIYMESLLRELVSNDSPHPDH
jgi:tetratricopeptide (TPR) repeat protein